MSHFGLKISKTESPDKTPYTVYYPHTIQVTERKWTQPYYQVVSIDPARKNYAMRIERRYHNGWITPIVFDKVSIEAIDEVGGVTIYNTYQVLTAFFEKYQQFYDDCHFIIIERQLPQNYRATRIAQHSISYFSIRLHNRPLLPSIIEIDSKVKGKVLGAPKGLNDKQLKSWAIEKARHLLTIRLDQFSLQVLDCFRNKQDDLSDTVCQAEALFICWGLLPTGPPPVTGPDNRTLDVIRPITLQLTPAIVIPGLVTLPVVNPLPLIQSQAITVPIPQVQTLSLTPIKYDILSNPPSLRDIPSIHAQQNAITSMTQTAPNRLSVLENKQSSMLIQQPRLQVTSIALTPTTPVLQPLSLSIRPQ